MSEETTFRFLTEQQAADFSYACRTAMSACGYDADKLFVIERDICRVFALEQIGDVRPEQMEEIYRWIITAWITGELEQFLQGAYQRATEQMQDIQTAYILVNRQRTLLSVHFKRALTIAAFVLVSLFTSAVSAQPINIQASATTDLANARTLTTTLTLEETQAWLEQYPAAMPYAALIQSVHKTNYLDHPAEYVIATLLTGEALISAKMNDSQGIKLFRQNAFYDLPAMPVNIGFMNSFSTSSAAPEGIEDDCFWCLQSCDGHARNVRGGEENVAVAKLAVAAIACSAVAAASPGAGVVCAAAALTVFYADINAAKNKYLQEIWKCGYSTCKRPNGTACRGRDR